MTAAPEGGAAQTAALDALDARDVRVERGEKTIVRGVSLVAAPGDVLGVLGPSGAGKSTLFRALVGEIPLSSARAGAENSRGTPGRILLAGEDVTDRPLWERVRAGIGYVPQTPSILWDLSVRENLRAYQRIATGRWFRKAPGEDAAVAAAASQMALEDRLDVRAGELSGGERRRLELARALTRTPKVLVCDEPFAGVDPQQASRLGDMLRDLAASGVAVLLADHHVAEALRVCTRAALLLDGQIAVEAEPDEFREHPLVLGRYLGSWARTLPPPPPLSTPRSH